MTTKFIIFVNMFETLKANNNVAQSEQENADIIEFTPFTKTHSEPVVPEKFLDSKGGMRVNL